MDLTAVFAELSRIRLGEVDLDGVMGQVAGLARRAVPGASEVSVTLIRDGKAQTVASTGETAIQIDEWQYISGEGPCLEAAARQNTLIVHDTARDDRWPGWAGEANNRGMLSVLAVGLPIGDRVGGAVNVYAVTPGAFGEEAVQVAETFASYAAVALANTHLYQATRTFTEHMQVALQSRAVIEQAKGIIMSQRSCTADEAFRILSKASQDSHRKLRDVAAALVDRVSSRPAVPATPATRDRRTEAATTDQHHG